MVLVVVPEYVKTERDALADVLEDRLAYYDDFYNDVRIIEARIALTFRDSRRVRMCTIKPPNFATFGRDGDADVIETFLRKRGFMNVGGIKPFNLPGAVLESDPIGSRRGNVPSPLA